MKFLDVCYPKSEEDSVRVQEFLECYHSKILPNVKVKMKKLSFDVLINMV